MCRLGSWNASNWETGEPDRAIKVREVLMKIKKTRNYKEARF